MSSCRNEARSKRSLAASASSDAGTGFRAIAAEVRERDDGLGELASGSSSSVTPGSGAPAVPGRRAPELPPPRLLGSFDPLLHGWADREPVLGQARNIVPVNGLFRPFALVDGRAVATWSLSAGQVALKPFAPLSESVAAALRADADARS